MQTEGIKQMTQTTFHHLAKQSPATGILVACVMSGGNLHLKFLYMSVLGRGVFFCDGAKWSICDIKKGGVSWERGGQDFRPTSKKSAHSNANRLARGKVIPIRIFFRMTESQSARPISLFLETW